MASDEGPAGGLCVSTRPVPVHPHHRLSPYPHHWQHDPQPVAGTTEISAVSVHHRKFVYKCTIKRRRHFQANTHTHPFNGLLSRTTRVSRYQKGKTNLDFAEARDSEWQWHQLGHMQVCTSLQTDNHTSTAPLSFLQAGCPSCRPTNQRIGTEGK